MTYKSRKLLEIWQKAIRSDARYVLTAASDARKASEYCISQLNLVRKYEENVAEFDVRLVVSENVPVPSAKKGLGKWSTLADSMPVGGSVELPAKHAQSLVAAIKRNKAVTRSTGVDADGVPQKTVWKQ